MKACSVPCNQCPFRKTSLPGWLADYTPESLQQLVMAEIPFPCHMLQHGDISIKDAMKGNQVLCKGAIIYMKKSAKSPRNKELKELVDLVQKSECDDILSAFEFLPHHTKYMTD